MKVTVVLCMLLLIAGCSQERIEQARAVAEQAEAGLARAVAIMDQSQQAIVNLRQQIEELAPRAEAVGATSILEKLKNQLSQAESVQPSLRNGVETARHAAELAQQALDSAETAARTGNWIKAGLGFVSMLLLGGGGVAARSAIRNKSAMRTAVELADQLKPLARRHNDDMTSSILNNASRAQSTLGVRSIVQKARGKA